MVAKCALCSSSTSSVSLCGDRLVRVRARPRISFATNLLTVKQAPSRSPVTSGRARSTSNRFTVNNRELITVFHSEDCDIASSHRGRLQAANMLRLLRRGLATRTLSADELIARGQFIKKSFEIFDLNSDKKIELHEVRQRTPDTSFAHTQAADVYINTCACIQVETAYLHKSAGSHVVRLLEETGELGGKGVTWELLEDFDLIKAWKEGKVRTTGDYAGEDSVLLEQAFTSWITNVLDDHANRTSSLAGAQDMME